jgi:hypothetical protein
LHWDGHGFLEIHPQHPRDVQFESRAKPQGDSFGFIPDEASYEEGRRDTTRQ